MPASKSSTVKLKSLAGRSALPYKAINFSQVNRQAQALADIIEDRMAELTDILLEYESHEVVQDEISRTLDLLRNLKENKKYFKLRIGQATAFLPRNQPLYAFACFVVVPSLMASEVYFRIPNSMRGFFSKVLKLLDIETLFPNIKVFSRPRLDFLTERSAILLNPKTKKSIPVNDVVIFTGTSVHASQLRLIFDRQTLFIANGSGHNPIVVSKDANLVNAVEATLTLQFYNQGQDCAAPNAVLVHKEILPDFLTLLRKKVKEVKIGHYRDKSCRIGPISEPKDLVRIEDFLIEHREWLDPATPGIIKAIDAIVEPTIICKPLSVGGNFKEIFAPIIFVQEYKQDDDLEYYFEDSRYGPNAMYVTLYGTSKYIKNLIDRPIHGKILHRKASFIHNTHLHAPGIERGTEPYGGYGYGASSLSINGEIIPMPTLPQRDIYERIVVPAMRKKLQDRKLKVFSKLHYKNISKLLKLKNYKTSNTQGGEKFDSIGYLDANSVKSGNGSYIKVSQENIYYLLKRPNAEYVITIPPEELKWIYELNKLLKRKESLPINEFRNLLYAIPKNPTATAEQNKALQSTFFQHVYQLLFGKKSGPRLAPFLLGVETGIIDKLLDV